MSAQHTPTPWSAEVGGGRGAWIKGFTGEWTALSCGDTDAAADANASFIVHAVNFHEDLLAALIEAEAFLRRLGWIEDADKALAAIAKARGEVA